MALGNPGVVIPNQRPLQMQAREPNLSNHTGKHCGSLPKNCSHRWLGEPGNGKDALISRGGVGRVGEDFGIICVVAFNTESEFDHTDDFDKKFIVWKSVELAGCGTRRGSKPTVAKPWCPVVVHLGLVDSLDGKDSAKVRIDVRERSHDRCPDQGTVIVFLRLYETK
jgi:hypothetical protein